MTLIAKIASNSAAIVASYIVNALFNFAIAIVLAAHFGAAGFGTISFLGIFYFFLGTLDSQWINPVLIREMSAHPSRAATTIGNGIVIRTCVAATAVIFFWITLCLVGIPRDTFVLALIVSAQLVLSSVTLSYVTILHLKLTTAPLVVYDILSKLLTFACVFLAVYVRGGLLAYYLLSLIPALLLLMQVKHRAEKLLKPVFTIEFRLWRELFKESWPLALSAVFIFLYHRLDQALLFRMRGVADVGLYAASVRLAECFTIIAVAFKTSLLPVLSHYHGISTRTFTRVYELGFKYLLALIIPVAFAVSAYAPRIISFFYGPAFSASSLPLRILIWAEVFVFMGVVNNAILIASRKQHLDPFFTGISALVNITLNVLLIPLYGIIAAASVSAIAYATGPIAGCFIEKTRAYSFAMARYSLRPLLASAAAFCLYLLLAKTGGWAFFLALFSYAAVLWGIRGIDRFDLRFLSALFSGRNGTTRTLESDDGASSVTTR